MNKQELIDFELRVKEAWEAGFIKAPLHLSGGNEDQLIDIFKEIKREDYVFSTHRNHYHALLHGVPPDNLMAEILGNPQAICKSRARSMGFISCEHNFYSSAIVGGLCALAVGTAWALKENASKNKVWCFIGDGGVDGGHFWEALQFACTKELPITFVVEDNDRATCSTKGDRGQRLGIYLTRLMSADNAQFVKWYKYVPTYPHVGSGKYIQF